MEIEEELEDDGEEEKDVVASPNWCWPQSVLASVSEPL